MSSNRLGFSLIELLVVVAIIGILAAVGTVGYQGYIDNTKDQAAKANLNIMSRAVEQDNLAIRENLGGASDINQGITSSSTCLAQVDNIVNHVNNVEGGRNPFNQNCFRAFNGNRLMSYYTSSALPTMQTWGLTSVGNSPSISACSFEPPVNAASAAKYVTVPRGAIMIACVSSIATVDSSDYKLYQCACTGESEGCKTTDIDFYTAADALGPGCKNEGADCKKNYMVNNPTKCPTPGD